MTLSNRPRHILVNPAHNSNSSTPTTYYFGGCIYILFILYPAICQELGVAVQLLPLLRLGFTEKIIAVHVLCTTKLHICQSLWDLIHSHHPGASWSHAPNSYHYLMLAVDLIDATPASKDMASTFNYLVKKKKKHCT